MARRILVAAFFSLSGICFADSLAGFLVDAECFDAAVRNDNPKATSLAERNPSEQVRYCRPDMKTKSFEVVDQNSVSFRLDPAGNVKAAELVRTTGKKSFFPVTVTGDRSKGAIKVDSISAGQ